MLSTSELGRREALVLAAASASSPMPTLALAPRMPALRLVDGQLLPLATFGLQIYDDSAAYKYTTQALEVGFRSFFTSPEAGNQRGFARAIRDSGLERSSVYIAGSVLSDEATTFRNGKALTTRACERSLEDLAVGGLESLDLLMLERPAVAGCEAIRGQWSALESLRSLGVARSLGTCNFDVDNLDCLLDGRRGAVACPPVVNQIGFNLATRMPHALLKRQHAERGVALMAWGPLGGPSALIPRSILDECAALGKSRGKTAEQVALMWLAQQGVAYVVHSRSASHLKEDLGIFDRTTAPLSEDEVARLERDSERAMDQAAAPKRRLAMDA